ncbi:hypothetical protein IQ250_27580, partial [Pseudanabaenaceae cyanobacterium LEGE 13415]|nr:hypothetical protein [Pseudanabaenaceae cyanobacterium LEGE 13415]
TYSHTQQISAMWAGLNTKTPVVNGYSGSAPPEMPGTMTETLPFSGIMQWLQSFKRPPKGRFCLIAATDDPLTAVHQVETGIPIESIGSTTQYFSRDRHYTAFVIPLPIQMPRQAYAHGIRAADQPSTLTSEQSITLPVFVRNTSPMTWVQTAAQPIHLSYRWFTASGAVDKGDGLRTELPTVVAPGAAIALNASIKAPSQPGTYTLRLSLVHETVTWFMDQGAKSLDLPITVIPSSGGQSNGKPKT